MTIFRWTSSLSCLLAVALLLGTGFLTPSQAVAQSSDDGPPTLVKHLRSGLQSGDDVEQQAALLDIVALANCPASCTIPLQSIQGKEIRIGNEAEAGSVMDLDALVPDLIKTYWRGPTDGHRLLALSALLYIGNERAFEQLIENGEEQSPAMEKTMHRQLASFYLENYPELTDRTVRTRQLSLDDVARAKALRVKKMKKAEKDKS